MLHVLLSHFMLANLLFLDDYHILLHLSKSKLIFLISQCLHVWTVLFVVSYVVHLTCLMSYLLLVMYYLSICQFFIYSNVLVRISYVLFIIHFLLSLICPFHIIFHFFSDISPVVTFLSHNL